MSRSLSVCRLFGRKLLVGFDVNVDGDVWCGEHAELIEIVARAHAVFGALGRRGSVERHARWITWLEAGKRPVEVEGQRYCPGDTVNGQ